MQLIRLNPVNRETNSTDLHICKCSGSQANYIDRNKRFDNKELLLEIKHIFDRKYIYGLILNYK